MKNVHYETCFACDKPLHGNPTLADTRDGQTVYVGPECLRRIRAAGEAGYQPPRGGPRLYLINPFLTTENLP